MDDQDERAAREVRRRVETFGLETIATDELVAPLLGRGEAVVAVRHDAIADPLTGGRSPVSRTTRTGTLYVTTTRVLHISCGAVLDLLLDAMEDAAIVGDRVLLLRRDGRGMVVRVEDPRLLRTQIALARAARTERLRRIRSSAGRR